MLAEGTNYFWLIYDVPSGATVNNLLDAECTSINVGGAQIPTVTAPAGTRVIKDALNGVYSIGASQVAPNYTTLTNANTDLGLYGVSGAVTFQLMGDYNSASETFPLVINAFTGASATNTLTIKPASGVTSTITGAVTSGALIKINGASGVTIDGSNNGSTDRSLTITNTATTAPTAISLVSLGVGLGATNNTVKNCNISTGVQTTTGYGISVGGATPGTTGADNDNVTIQNNNITNCGVGIYAIGTAAVTSGGDDNLNITGNTIDYNGVLTVPIAIRVGYTLNSSISQNTIDVETTALSAAGITLETGANNTVVSRNLIRKVKSTNTISSSYPRGIVVGTGQTGSAITLSNNVIYNVIANFPSSTVGFNHAGIVIGAVGTSTTMSTVTGGVNLYFNSVNIYGNSDRSIASLCMAVHFGSAVSSIDLRNNIFANSSVNINAGATAAKSYAIYSQSANTAFTTINNNDYFVSGSQGVLGLITSDRADLTAIQAGFGQNLNSVNTNPLYISSNDLTINSGLTPIATESGAATGTGINIDYTGATRPAGGVNGGGTAPDMGAYEFDGVPVPPCATPTAQPTVLVLNATGQTTVSGSFTAASPAASNYLVIRTTSNTLAATPVNTTTYAVGANALFGTGGYVESNGAGLTINSTGLTSATTYYYWVFSFNTGSCTGGPLYLTASPLSGSVLTGALFSSITTGNWEDGTTWNQSGAVPYAGSDVTIVGGHNVTVNAAGNVASNVTINATGTLTVASGVLTMGSSSAGAANGNSNKLLNVNGTLAITGGTLNVNGGVSLNSTSTFNTSSGIFNIDPNDGTAGGSFANTNGGFYINTNSLNVTGGAINFLDPMYTATAGNGQSVMLYSSPSVDASFGIGCTVTFGGGDDTNPLNLNGFYPECSFNVGTLEIGTCVFAGGRYSAQRGLITRQAITGYITKFKNFTINAGAEVYLNALGSMLSITGNLINNGIITNSALVTGATGGVGATGLVFADAQFDAVLGNVYNPLNINQSISGTGYFKKSLVDADPTGLSGNITGSIMIFHSQASPGLTLNVPLTITGNLSLWKGKVNTTTTNTLVLGHGTSLPNNGAVLVAKAGTLLGSAGTSFTTAGSYDGGYIVGPFDRYFLNATNTGQTGLMPVGSDTSRPAQILFTTAPTTPGYLTATWVNGTGTSAISPALNEPAVTPSTIDLVLNPYWKIQNLGTLTGGIYSSIFTLNNANNILNFANTTLLKRIDGGTVSDWVIQGTHIATTGSNTYPTLSRSGLTTFSEFSIGGNANGVLPVTIEYFRGSKQALSNILDWKVTCTTEPSISMSLERSADGRSFISIQDQTATNARCLQSFDYVDATPLAGYNYYRLKTVTLDGKVKYSTIVVLLNKEKGFELISLAPNPVQNTAVLSLTTVKGGKIELSVSDVAGKVISKQAKIVIAGNNPINMNFASLSTGTYIITAVNADGEIKTTRFIKL